MKKSTILTTLSLFIFLSFSGMAQKSLDQKMKHFNKRITDQSFDSNSTIELNKHFAWSKGMVSKPGNSVDYYWETGSETWIHSSNTSYTYNNSGQILESLETDPSSGENLWKGVRAYDSHGEMTEYIAYIWSNNAWEISYGYKYTNTYENGNMTEQIYYNWDFQSADWVEEWKDIFIYNNNGHLTEVIYQDWVNDAWENDSRDVFTLNSNNAIIELIFYEWDGSDWAYDEMFFDIVWHEWSGWDNDNSEPESYTSQVYENGIWVNSERYDATYTGNNYIGIYEIWENNNWEKEERETYSITATEEISIYENWENGQWVNDSRDTFTYDDHGNSAGYKYEIWENGAWVTEFAYGISRTYNNDGDITEFIYSQWDFASQSMVYSERREFSNFQYFESGINNLNSLTNVSIYPNPVVSSINIQINEADVNSYQLEIINITGQTILRNSYSILETSIDLANLNRGIYLIRITTDNNKTGNYKFVKE